MIITLLGYMGCGKSTIGKELAQIMGYVFIDLDNYIETKEGKSITAIFNDKGEVYFRKKENEYLKEILDTKNKIVLSLGGGTPCYGNNMDLVNSKTYSVYLNLSVDKLTERLYAEKEHRPLISHLNTQNSLNEFIGIHLFERSPYYLKAHANIKTDNLTVKETISKVVACLY